MKDKTRALLSLGAFIGLGVILLGVNIPIGLFVILSTVIVGTSTLFYDFGIKPVDYAQQSLICAPECL